MIPSFEILLSVQDYFPFLPVCSQTHIKHVSAMILGIGDTTTLKTQCLPQRVQGQETDTPSPQVGLAK